MASWVTDRKGYLRIQFYLHKKRCRESFRVRDTRDERRAREGWRRDLENALRHPETFKYGDWFPMSRQRKQQTSVISSNAGALLDLLERMRNLENRTAESLRELRELIEQVRAILP
jgi:hypothetical protein